MSAGLCRHCNQAVTRIDLHERRCLANPTVRARYRAQLSDGCGHVVTEATWVAWTARHPQWLRSDSLTAKVRRSTGRGGWRGVAEFFGLEVEP